MSAVSLDDITKLLPRFVTQDKNGYALAKALETGLQIWLDTVQAGVDCVLDVEKMPEWRLDEMAWELGCLYDYNAGTEQKRAWIRDAVPLYAKYGTVAGIYKFLKGYFDGIEVEEWWQYGGKPYHFRVTATGEWSDENETWARKAIARLQNVRSVLDDLSPGSNATIYAKGDTWYIKFPYLMADGSPTGTTPEIAYIGKASDGTVNASGAESRGYRFPYVMTGTTPQEAYTAAGTDGSIKASNETKGYRFTYEMPSEDALTGTTPDIATLGAVTEAEIEAKAETRGYKFPYALTGTGDTENTGFAQATSAADTQSEGEGTVFSYEPASEESLCGDDDAL